jgi:hypothetical protein
MKNIKSYESFQMNITVDVKNIEDSEDIINPNTELVSSDDEVQLINQQEEETVVEEPNIIEDETPRVLNISDFMKSFIK